MENVVFTIPKQTIPCINPNLCINSTPYITPNYIKIVENVYTFIAPNKELVPK